MKRSHSTQYTRCSEYIFVFKKRTKQNKTIECKTLSYSGVFKPLPDNQDFRKWTVSLIGNGFKNKTCLLHIKFVGSIFSFFFVWK